PGRGQRRESLQDLAMSIQPDSPWFTAERVGPAVVVRFTRGHFLDDELIRAVGEQLLRLVDETGPPKLVLNLAGVQRLESTMLAKLVTLHIKIDAANGRLALCGLSPDLYEVFRTLWLTRSLWIYGTEQEALQTF